MARGDELTDPSLALPACVRPATYWFWSRVPTRVEAERQTREIARAGFSTVMIQTRLSFDREQYLSPAYLRGYRAAVEAAGAAGLQVGIYDEYNWASGHGGGRTVTGADHLRERHLFWTSTAPGARPATATVSSIRSDWMDDLGPAGLAWVYEDGRRRWDEWELVAAIAHPPGRVELAATVDVVSWASCHGGPDGCEILVEDRAPVPAGWIVTVFVAARCATSRLVNYLDPRAAERFVEVCYEPYAAACDGLIGDPIRSFSFDHPYGGFYDWRERRGAIGNSLMWDGVAALERAGRTWSLGQLLLAAVHDVGPDAASARCELFATYSARGVESFFGTLGRWAHEHGVALTGHELLPHVGGWGLDDAFPFVDARTNFGSDAFAIDRHRTETLVDASNFSAQLSPRMGDSVARAHGRSRCIVEQYAARNELPGHYAAGYWELALDELRRQALRIHVLGGRQFLFHAYNQSDDADGDDVLVNPRFDFPPAVNFEPWFGHFAAFAGESAAVSAFIDGAEPIREVALVYPLHTIWADGPAHRHAELFGAWAQLLARAGVGFDVVEDRALDGADVAEGQIGLHDHRYRAVILAGVATLPAPGAVDALQRLADAGGVVLATAPLPVATATGGADERLADRVAALCTEPVCDEAPTAVPRSLRRCDTAPALQAGDGPGTVWRWVGRDEHGLRIVLLNDGPARRRITTAVAGPARARRLRDGAWADWPWSRPHEDVATATATAIAIDLEPDEVACLSVTAGADPVALAHATGFVSDVAVSDDGALRVRADRGARLELRGDDGVTAGDETPVAATAPQRLSSGWTLSAAGSDPVAIDPDRGWEQQGMASYAGAGTYRCTFDAPAAIGADEPWALTLPSVHCAVTATLNGVDLGARGWPPYRFELPAGLLRESGNELSLTVVNSAANRYYASTPYQAGLQPSGLGAAPVLEPGPVTRHYAPGLAVRAPQGAAL